MATIKIKFKDTLTLTSDFDFLITFTSNSTTFTRMKVSQYISYNLNYGTTKVYDKPTNSWVDTVYQVIEIDTNQNEFNAFITAMKSNIEGVELEQGTYKWVDNLSITGASGTNLNYTSADEIYIKIEVDELKERLRYFDTLSSFQIAFQNGTWANNSYKTITTTTNQYIDYDFYNYAILGNQLVKQTAPTPTSYSITYNLTNCTGDSSNPTIIENTASVIVTANRGYKLPSTITVNNATYTYEQSTGMIDLSNPTGDVTITVVATQDDIIVYENQLVSIANAIRQVNSSSAKIKLDDMPSLIGTFTKPTGTKTITDTNLTDVRNYANAQVSDANLTSANIVTGKTILGIAGTFSSDGTLDASKMLKGVIGYSKGNKIIGIIETYNGEIIEE